VTGSIGLNTGGTTNAPAGYIVYRSSTPQGAVLKAAGQLYDVLDVYGNYMIMDGFTIDGSDFGLSSSPVTMGSCMVGWGHHFQALNNVVHDCGGEGVAALYKDWYWFIGNTSYNNAHFNGYQMSGISIYEPRAVQFTPSAADSNATYHIIIEENTSHDNAETFVQGSHTDGNCIILDDFQNTQSGMAPYPYNSLVQGNIAYNCGARGIHLFFTNNVVVTGNTVYNNNLDLAIDGTYRGELSNAFGSNNSWINNQASTTSVPSNIRQFNTAVLDGYTSPPTTNVIWQNNANIDTRTGGLSYQMVSPSRAAAFPMNNPLGKPLPAHN
jgi:parallel beta-helix repeat protein